MSDVETPTPGETQEEIQPQEPASEEAEQPAEEPQDGAQPVAEEPAPQPSRKEARISDLIAEKKRLEEENAYYQRQLEARENVRTQPAKFDPSSLRGVSDEGIDPVEYAASLREAIIDEVTRNLSQGAKMNARQAEELEVSKMPEMQDEFFRKGVVRMAKAENMSPLDAFLSFKEEMESIGKRSSVAKAARDNAGKFVREETATPAATRSDSGAGTSFTRKQISEMSESDYVRNQTEINRQLTAGLIK